jgi:hypothetical protein
MADLKRGWVKTENGWEPLREREKTIVALLAPAMPGL